jgi:chromosome segregation ATPase
VINVREVLETHSQATTLRELEAKGRSKVRVINAAEITRLIEEAVRQTIAGSSGKENMQELIEKSKAEFRDLKRQRDTEHEAREAGVKQLDSARGELTQLGKEVEQLRNSNKQAASHATELEGLLTKEKQRSGELQTLVSALTKERDLARQAEKELRSNPAAAVAEPGTQNEMLAKLAQTVEKLSEKIDKNPASAIPASPVAGQDLDKMHSKLEALSSGIADRLDKFSKSLANGNPGGGSGLVEAQAVRYDKIFEGQEKLESNFKNVEVKQEKGKGIGGTLDRMKKLRLGPAPADEKEPKK